MGGRFYQPFTYLIGWKQLDRWYYGVRYARGCHPDDLWTKYFTRSEYVLRFREEHGEPDVIEVRQTFNDSLQAREWEHKVLRRTNAVKDERWLNKTDNKSISPDVASHPGCQNPMYGKTHSQESKRKMIENNAAKRPEVREKMSKSAKGKKKGPQSEQHKINRGIFKGRPHSKETKEKIGLHSRNRSIETRKKLGEASKGKTNVYDCLEKTTKRISVKEFNENRDRYVSLTSKRYRECVQIDSTASAII